MKKILISTGLLIGSVTSAMANDDHTIVKIPKDHAENFMPASQEPMAFSEAKTGFVIGGQVGYAKPTGALSDFIDDPDPQDHFDNGNIMGGIFFGYDFALTNFLSIGPEIGINYGHNVEQVHLINDETIRQDQVTAPLFFKVKLVTPFGLNVFGKAGYAFNQFTVDESIKEDFKLPEHSFNPAFAGGVGFQIYNFNIFAQATYYDLEDDGTKAGTSVYTGGISYTFSS